MGTDTTSRERQGLTTLARIKHERMKQLQADRDEAIRAAVAAGVTHRQIGNVVGLSHQRIAQIVKQP